MSIDYIALRAGFAMCPVATGLPWLAVELAMAKLRRV